MSELNQTTETPVEEQSWWQTVSSGVSNFFGNVFSGGSIDSEIESTIAPKAGVFENREGVKVYMSDPPTSYQLEHGYYTEPTSSNTSPPPSSSNPTPETETRSILDSWSASWDRFWNGESPDPTARQPVPEMSVMGQLGTTIGKAVVGDYTPTPASPSLNTPTEALGRVFDLEITKESFKDYAQLTRALSFLMVIHDHKNLKRATTMHALSDVAEGYFDTREAGRPTGQSYTGLLEPYALLASLAVTGYAGELVERTE